MADNAQTFALAQTFYQIVRFSPADRKALAVSKIQVALNELIDADRLGRAVPTRNPPPVELDPVLNAERN